MARPLELWWESRDKRRFLLGASHDSYAKSVSYINQLEQELRDSIPFPYEVLEEAEVHVFGGDTRKWHVVVTMVIRPSEAVPLDADAFKRLGKAGFHHMFDSFLV